MLFWAVDLYDESKLDENMLASLQINCDNVFKINSNGMFLSQLVTVLKAKLINEQQRLLSGEKAMTDWAHYVVEISKAKCVRLLAVLRHGEFLNAFEQFVDLAYGQEFFQFALAEMIVNSKLDKVRFPNVRSNLQVTSESN